MTIRVREDLMRVRLTKAKHWGNKSIYELNMVNYQTILDF